MMDLERVRREALQLAPLPPTVSRLLQVFAGEDWSLDEIVDTIRADPPLTGRLLRLANSARSGSQSQIGTIDAAVTRVGRSSVTALAMAMAVRDSLVQDMPAFGIGPLQAWRHAVAASVIADLLRIGHSDLPEELPVAALLHDIGRSILARCLGRQAEQELRQARAATRRPWVQLEREILGVTHADVGGSVAESWRLPPLLEAGILYHHEPEAFAADDEQTVRLCHAIRIADCTAHLMGEGSESPRAADFEGSLDVLRMTEEQWETLRSSATDRFDGLLQAYDP